MAGVRAFRLFAAAALAVASIATGTAQEPLPVEAGQPWTHAHSGITIPATLDELPRVRATSFASPQLDISQNFASSDGLQALTIYIFRNTNGSVPLWFAQAQRAISLREDLKNPPLGIDPVVFTPPGQAAQSGLKAVFAPAQIDGVRSTGVAMFAVGDWDVKLRATSATLSANDLSDWMEGALQELKLPRGAGSPAVQPIADCSARVAFTSDAIDWKLPAAALTSGVATPASRMAATRWCRDSLLTGNQAVYRPDGAPDRYLLAAGDNGKTIAVQAQAPGGYYSVNFITAGQVFTLVAQDRLPSPARVLELVTGDRTVAAAPTWPPR